ncbi:MAG: methyltransferase [Bacteroidota bacterium]
MKIKEFGKYYILIGALAVLAISGCAPETSGLISNVYHNTTARYNAYFYARLQMEEIQQAIAENEEVNYNKTLKIFPAPDTNLINGLSEQIDDCVKKASIAIERHPSSRWADDSYIIVGQSRSLNQNYIYAIKTFKYVNTHSEDDDARHQALIHLMRTFIEADEQNNAVSVSDYLRKEKLNRTNKVQFYLTRAYLAQLNEDYNAMVGNLLIAAPLMENKEGRAKTFFILGQLYQELGFDAQAYQNYEEVLKSNPEYELFFYTRLNMAQVYDLSQEKDTKKIRKYFVKLLKDQKNVEYRDKIYYEMAQFEQKQDELELAIEYYDESVRASVSNNRQKAYSYWELGKIYYDEYAKYELAKAYYDSTIAVLPQDEPEYEAIAARQQILSNFVEQLTIIKVQDSLLALAEMDTLELSAYLDEVIAEQEQQQRQEERLAARQARRQRAVSQFGTTPSPFATASGEGTASASASVAGGENWYFYSPAAISQGQTAFVRKWGNRSLEDNWRRSNKTIENNFAANDEEQIEVQDPVLGDPSADAGTANSAGAKQTLYADIPFTSEQKQEAYQKIEDAYFKLGGIYNFDLEEKANAIETFETLLSRFPGSEYGAEVLYQLYLLYQEQGDEATATRYKNQLLTDYPESIFAKVIRNPNYREESNLASAKLQKIYEEAYRLYQKGAYQQAEPLVQAALAEYDDNDFVDNMKLLQILIEGKLSSQYEYQYALQGFIDEYPESEVTPYAQELLTAAQGFQDKLAAQQGAKYIEEFDQKHSFIVVYNSKGRLSSELPRVIDKFNDEQFGNAKLTSANLMLESGQVMVIVEEFPDQSTAQAYFEKFNSDLSPLNNLPLSKAYDRSDITSSFVITEDNLPILYRTKDIENYLRFFEKHYTF